MQGHFRRVDIGDMKAPPAREDFGPAPDLRWLEIADMVIDGRYQREIGPRNIRSIEAIARAFEWAKFSPVLVAPVEGGKFAVIDGQHRIHAAALCGILSVPCQSVNLATREQAAAFTAVNGNTVKITAFHIYRAALAAGEPWACGMRDCVEAAGCRAMTGATSTAQKKPGEIYCLTFIRERIARTGPEPVTWALDGLRRSDRGGAEPWLWGYAFLRPWVLALTARFDLRRGGVDLAGFVDALDIRRIEREADARIDGLRRTGGVTPPRHDLIEAALGEELDRFVNPGQAPVPPAALVVPRIAAPTVKSAPVSPAPAKEVRLTRADRAFGAALAAMKGGA